VARRSSLVARRSSRTTPETTCLASGHQGLRSLGTFFRTSSAPRSRRRARFPLSQRPLSDPLPAPFKPDGGFLKGTSRVRVVGRALRAAWLATSSQSRETVLARMSSFLYLPPVPETPESIVDVHKTNRWD
jgi:hypothetical protein